MRNIELKNNTDASYPEDGSPMIAYALYYASLGIPVFPVRPNTKDGYYEYPEYRGEPSIKYPEGSPFSWKAQASTDPERICQFWHDHPEANIGGRTGNGLAVIDLDREHDKTSDGWERYRQWERDTGKKLNTETAMSLTGNGGNQLFYRYDPSEKLQGGSNIFKDDSGCDTRGEGNYVILPPSIHPNGNRYEWEQPIDEYPILKADEAFFLYWGGSSSGSRSSKKDPFNPDKKVTSCRHDYMTSYCGWMLNSYPNLKEEEYFNMLRKKNEKDIFPPLGMNHDDKPDELEKTIFPLIPKLMIRDGMRRVEKEKEAEQFDESVNRDNNYWNSLYENMDNQTSTGKTEPETGSMQSPDQYADLPELDDISEIWNDMPDPEPELIHGILRQGHKLGIAGSSKKGKSMLLIQLAVAIASGGFWMGRQCETGKVLYINLEIDPKSFNKTRVKRVCDAKHISQEMIKHKLKVWHLRGHTLVLERLVDAIIQRYSKEHFTAVIIDPIYKVMEGDENKAGDVAKFCNQIDRLATELNCSVIYMHHFTKGSQAGKASIDRASGSGVYARDVDALITYTEIESDNDDPAFRLEFTLREFPEPKPINVRFCYPIHIVDDEGSLKDAKIKGAGESRDDKADRELEELAGKIENGFCHLSIKEHGHTDGPVKLKDLAEWIVKGKPNIRSHYLYPSERTLPAKIKSATDHNYLSLEVRNTNRENGGASYIYRIQDED